LSALRAHHLHSSSADVEPSAGAEELCVDALVVGSGASGMAAAITARLHGLDVRLIEKDPVVGGATAYSYGTMWVPGSPAAQRAGIVDDREAARTYLRHVMGADHELARSETYLEYAPRMLAYFEQHTAASFLCRHDFPDHHSDRPGAALGGRTVSTAPFDARVLGAELARLRPPLAGQTWLGMMYTPQENRLVSDGRRRWRAAAHLARRMVRHVGDMARHGRTTWLTNGNALAARLFKSLFKSCIDLAIPVWTDTCLRRLLCEEGRVVGAEIERGGRLLRVRARRGVVLACGGFGRDLARCEALFERPQLDGLDWSLAPAGNTGDGLRVALEVGARIEPRTTTAAFWAPVSRPTGEGAAPAGHFHDRHRPGFLAVTREGRRFANEALSNHHFAEAMVRAARPGEAPLAWLITDHRSLRRVGCGDAILPFPAPLGPHLRSGYLHRGCALEALAQAIGLPPATLKQTVEEFNAQARAGRDLQFGKGDNAFDRYFGEQGRAPNPCLGPLGDGPYYAVRMTAGHMGTLAGLQTDLHARALDAQGAPIVGLHAVGNDMASVFGGACPGGGITLGPGMTFAWLAALHLAGVDPAQATPRPDAAIPTSRATGQATPASVS
jgi:succinate dehydrogenase/fumarate reductase flavoprotein subunit